MGTLTGLFNAAVDLTAQLTGLGSGRKPEMKDTYAVARRQKSSGVPTSHSH